LALPPESRWLLDQRRAELEHLSALIVSAESQLETATRHDPVIKKLREQPGVGPVTPWVLRAEIGRFDRFVSGKQLAKFCGVTPRNASSGERQADAGLIANGRPLLRTCLIEAAQRLARYTAPWKNLAQRLRRRGKPGAVTIAVIANRWMRWLHHVMVEPEACS
jgi:transposase